MYDEQYNRTKRNYNDALARRAKQLGFDSLEQLKQKQKEDQNRRREYKKLQGFNPNI